MLFNLLTASDAVGAATSSGATPASNPWQQWIIIGLFAVLLIVFMVINRRSQKKRQEETNNMLNSIQPGNKVKTIGGICGIVVEVCPEDNTFVLETGTEASGKSYLKFDKQAIYQTDAVTKKEEKAEEKPEETTETPTEETKADKE